MKHFRRSSHHGIKVSGGLRHLKYSAPSMSPKHFLTGSKPLPGLSTMKWILAVVAVMLLIGCGSPRQDEKLPSSSEEYQTGETVYVCGCPMMCCNSISRNPEDRCICNMPLRKGTVSKIQDHIIIVTVFGREKVIFLKYR